MSGGRVPETSRGKHRPLDSLRVQYLHKTGALRARTMAEEAEKVPFGRRFRHFLRSQRFALSILGLILGVFMTVLAVGAFTPLQSVGPFPSINSVTDQSSKNGPNYNLVFVIAGPIVTIIGAYLVGA